MIDTAAVLAAFVAGTALGLVPWWLHRRRHPDPEPADRTARRRTVRLVALTALTTLVASGGIGFAALRLLLRSDPPAAVSADDALARYRARPAQGTAPPPAAVPADGGFTAPEPGVYTYRAAGFFALSAPIFGEERRDLPETVPVTVESTPDGWTWTVAYFDRHQVTARFRSGPDATLEQTALSTRNEHFGIEVSDELTCDPPRSAGRRDPDGFSWEQGCVGRTSFGTGTVHRMPTRVTLVGRETLRVGDREVPALHLRRETRVEGDQTGSIVRETWIAEATGLPLRITVRSRTQGLAENVEEFSLELESVQPRR